jgi:L-asparagine transporter-like permease
MVGAGVFVITGAAANGLAGPSVLLSYTVSGKDCSMDQEKV